MAKMKRVLAGAMAVTLAATSLAGCSSSSSTDETSTDETTVESTDETATAEESGEEESVVTLSTTEADTIIGNLLTNDLEDPLAVDDTNPAFTWTMESNVVGQAQSAYQIVVTDEDGNVVWDTDKVESDESQVLYDGDDLTPDTAYTWDLTVWDASDNEYTASASFETGLMTEATISEGVLEDSWDGAEFIGSNELILDATSTCLYTIETTFQIEEGSDFSVVFGADDFRLNDDFQNVWNVEGENYVRIELDLSGIQEDGTGGIINVYRPGYADEDASATEPYDTKDIATGIFTPDNVNDEHTITVTVETGSITVMIDGTQAIAEEETDEDVDPWMAASSTTLSVSELSTGNNFNTYPNLNSVGFAVNAGTEVLVSYYEINADGQTDEEYEVQFNNETGATYAIWDGLDGITVDGDQITVSGGDEGIVAYADPSYGSETMVRTEFSTDEETEVVDAKLYVTAAGIFEFYINGERVGEDYFAPGDSQYRETLTYTAYDVTDLVTDGDNAMGAILAGGWYTGYMTFTPSNYNFFGNMPSLLAMLEITYADGTTETIVTDDETWEIYTDGPVVSASFFQGERYDATKEAAVEGWSTVDYDDSAWSTAEVVELRDWIDCAIVARYDEEVSVYETETAESVLSTHSDDGETWTYDFGDDLSAISVITVPTDGMEEGDTIILRYGEMIYPGNEDSENTTEEYEELYGEDGTYRAGVAGRILQDTYRAALASDFYIVSAEDIENGYCEINTSLTYRSYRYVQITVPGSTEALDLENVQRYVISSVQETTYTYEAETTDDTITTYVNQLITNIENSQLSNFMTIPTDCPQRNERMGWTGDAQAYSLTSTYISDSLTFFRQWMRALRDDQSTEGGIGSTVPTYSTEDSTTFDDGTTWAAAVCVVPWRMYSQYGNTQIITENMDAMTAWLDGMDSYDFEVTDDDGNVIATYEYLSSKASGLADWLSVDDTTTSDICNNAIYIYCMDIVAQMARAIGEDEIAEKYEERSELAKEQYNEVYFDTESGRTTDANGNIMDSQSSYSIALNYGVWNEENAELAEERLAELAENPSDSQDGESDTEYPEWSITTGFAGTPTILPALSKAGDADEAANMFTCTDYASWLYEVSMGATSMWERWNSYELAFQDQGESSMNSFNHFALGAVGAWVFEYQLGISSGTEEGLEGGYQEFVLQPEAGGIFTSASGDYDSSYGTIHSEWTADSTTDEDGNGTATMTSYSCTLPANTSATLYLPADFADAEINTTGVTYEGTETHNGEECAVFTVTAGSYSFTYESVELGDGYFEAE